MIACIDSRGWRVDCMRRCRLGSGWSECACRRSQRRLRRESVLRAWGRDRDQDQDRQWDRECDREYDRNRNRDWDGYGMVWYGMVRYGMVWYGMVWYGVG